ncbi:MAG TPA: alkyl sulfatase C-terminal domain-containing protein [Jatrophihabitans sp.]|jgi:alkyl sulfatase BDS1-like metallo-beta-lactamase superfamily hydrolase
MATIEECEDAFHRFAAELEGDAAARKKAQIDRTLSCTVTDLGVVFGARLYDGTLTDIRRTGDPSAQVRLSMASDDLVAMVDGGLSMAKAWAAGRVKIHASPLDLLRLKNVF